MNRDLRIAGTAWLAVIGAGLLLAPNAWASEGQLKLFPDPAVVLLLIALFALLIYPVNQLIVKPIFRVLDEREEKIAGTRRRADRLAEEAAEILKRYEDSVREVRQDSEQQRKRDLEEARAQGIARTAEARSEAEQEVSRARDQMSTSLDEARASLRAQSDGLAREVAARALGRVLS